MNPFQVVRDFEKALCEYTGARYAVTTNSCTMALFLCFAWAKRRGAYGADMWDRTYPSVPMQAYHAGFKLSFREAQWKWTKIYHVAFFSYDSHQYEDLNVWDCARRLTSGMYRAGEMQCVSFHAKKLLKIGQGGAILHDNEEADAWFRRMRFDGRTEGVPTSEDDFTEPGYHCYMSPDAAARGLWLLSSYPKNVPDNAEDCNYPDMSRYEWK